MSSTGPLKVIEFFTSTLNDTQKPRTLREETHIQLHGVNSDSIMFWIIKAFLRLPFKAECLLKRAMMLKEWEQPERSVMLTVLLTGNQPNDFKECKY